MKYDFKAVEAKWQKVWQDEHTFHAEIDHSKPKFYALVEFPYPSAAGLHVGHPRSYTALDIVARKKRQCGYNVLYPMGWDAFGLPTENYALKNHINPEIVTGVALMLMYVFIFRATGLLKPGFTTLLLSHITFCIPYVVLQVMPKLRQMNRHMYEAALDLGCRPSSAFFKVVLPEILPGVVTGMLMAFTMSLDDFVISYFTSGSSAQNLSVTIYSMTKRRITPEINALSTLLFGTVLLLLILVNVWQIRDKKKARY